MITFSPSLVVSWLSRLPVEADLQAMLTEPIDLATPTRIFIRSGVLTKLGRRFVCGNMGSTWINVFLFVAWMVQALEKAVIWIRIACSMARIALAVAVVSSNVMHSLAFSGIHWYSVVFIGIHCGCLE